MLKLSYFWSRVLKRKRIKSWLPGDLCKKGLSLFLGKFFRVWSLHFFINEAWENWIEMTFFLIFEKNDRPVMDHAKLIRFVWFYCFVTLLRCCFGILGVMVKEFFFFRDSCEDGFLSLVGRSSILLRRRKISGKT